MGAKEEEGGSTGINDNQNNMSAFSSGAVYLFTRTDAIWSQQAYIKASNTAEGSLFGGSVSLNGDGNTLAVGAAEEEGTSTGINGIQNNTGAIPSGAVYLFTRTDTLWSQQAYIKASNTAEGSFFGGSVSLSEDGNTLAVGAAEEGGASTGINGNQNGTNSISGYGAVYLFTRTDALWRQKSYVKASNTGEGDQFGASVSLNGTGNTLAVGAAGEGSGESSSAIGINGDQSNNLAAASGAVYLY